MKLCKCGCRFLLAIDPGFATGICMIDMRDPQNPVKLWSAEVTMEEFYDKIEDLIKQESTHVVFERFKITEETPDSPWSLEHIGNIKLFCHRYGKKWDQQTPSDAKEFSTSEKLQAVGFWHVGGEGHANDAFRHAMLWYVRRNARWTKTLLV
jgi:hypothetical protein